MAHETTSSAPETAGGAARPAGGGAARRDPYVWTLARTAFAVCAIEHLFTFLWAGMLLDGGAMIGRFLTASLAFWGGVLFLALRRRLRFESADCLYVALGYPALFVVVFVIVELRR